MPYVSGGAAFGKAEGAAVGRASTGSRRATKSVTMALNVRSAADDMATSHGLVTARTSKTEDTEGTPRSVTFGDARP